MSVRLPKSHRARSWRTRRREGLSAGIGFTWGLGEEAGDVALDQLAGRIGILRLGGGGEEKKGGEAEGGMGSLWGMRGGALP